FVPTLGALHDGHMSLVQRSLEENDWTVVSLFLNPTQFNDPKDLENYPSSFEEDCRLLEGKKNLVIFHPTAHDLYPDENKYQISESELSKQLCGLTRKGHFEGVLTVVMKLLQIVAPTKAYFGEKDFQQLE